MALASEAVIADRAGDAADTLATVAGRLPSPATLIRDTDLASPGVGDVLVTPATGAYGYAMANNYNGVPRPPAGFRDREAEASSSAARAGTDLLARDE